MKNESAAKRTLKKSRPASEGPPTDNPVFVVHRHQARALHWDLRLEKDGVLVSWAVPKEPPTTKGVRRLAIQVEDHPVDYATFEGTIAEGEYGAGTVEVWDHGTYQTERWSDKEIVVRIKGQRLTGRYCLIRFAKVENGWLFFRCDG